jgi:hypothetical protein
MAAMLYRPGLIAAMAAPTKATKAALTRGHTRPREPLANP